jgi:hypothetical protein
MEPILDYIKRHLRQAGPQAWPDLAQEADCSVHTLRKIAYNDAKNPQLQTVQALVSVFQAVDRGERSLSGASESKASA